MITKGQQGRLGKELLTVVSISENGEMFTCDNGKTYMVKFSKWMTEGAVVAAPKAKKAKKVTESDRRLSEELQSMDTLTAEDFRKNNQKLEEIQEKSRMHQRGSSLR